MSGLVAIVSTGGMFLEGIGLQFTSLASDLKLAVLTPHMLPIMI